MKIFITGATGYIGRNLIKNLIKSGYHCTVYVRRKSELSVIDSEKCKILCQEEINSLISHFCKENYDGVVHLAGLYINTHKPDEIKELIYSNVLFGTYVLEAAIKSSTKWFINTGTVMQHYNDKDYSPTNLYAATKQAFEDITKYYSEISNICITTLKLSDTYGPNDLRSKFFSLWKKTAITGGTLDMSPGNQIIDILHIDDVVKAYKLIIENIALYPKLYKNQSYIIPSKQKYTLKELAVIYEKNTKYKININWGKLSYRNREIMKPYDKCKVLPNWEQSISLQNGIESLFK